MSFKVIYNQKETIYQEPVMVLDIVGNDTDIVCVYVNRRVRELTYVLDKDAEIIPLTYKDRDAKPIYEASLRFLVAMAMHNIYPQFEIRFAYNVSRSIFVQILNQGKCASGMMINELIKEMNRLVALDLPLIRQIVSKEEAARIFKEDGYQDKVDILKYRPEKTSHIYKCGDYRNYMYNRMVPSTGYIKKWLIRYYHPGFIIQYPRPDFNGEIPPFEDAPTFGKTLKRAHQWATATGCDNVVGINQKIEKDGDVDLITLCEQNHNRQLCELGQMIEDEKDSFRLICIAGPSSSGKTTFANRLRIELLSRGIRPIRISMDDYYINRKDIPLDENGDPDIESADALDIALFNRNLADLIAGLEVALPKYDFITGTRVKGRTLTVPYDQPIIIEGIHALNERLTQSIPSHQKYKIFIAPQSQINIDNHNPMSLTDLRLLRRIVRDNQFRNSSAIETIAMWPNVRKGEFKWIYDTQEGADFVFNSFSSYELSVMKKYAMPLLEEIDTENEHFPVVERLLRMLKFFNDLPDTWVPCNSIIREFIGGSCYQEE
ncbi:MAG TPA: nucleoside kinase [Erysipelotrichaceae bacterium]|nr:nucleoside kinase [Erysipelotrichaceae bacterium]